MKNVILRTQQIHRRNKLTRQRQTKRGITSVKARREIELRRSAFSLLVTAVLPEEGSVSTGTLVPGDLKRGLQYFQKV